MTTPNKHQSDDRKPWAPQAFIAYPNEKWEEHLDGGSPIASAAWEANDFIAQLLAKSKPSPT